MGRETNKPTNVKRCPSSGADWSLYIKVTSSKGRVLRLLPVEVQREVFVWMAHTSHTACKTHFESHRAIAIISMFPREIAWGLKTVCQNCPLQLCWRWWKEVSVHQGSRSTLLHICTMKYHTAAVKKDLGLSASWLGGISTSWCWKKAAEK